MKHIITSKKKIPLKVYAKVPILRVEIDETCGEERDKNE